MVVRPGPRRELFSGGASGSGVIGIETIEWLPAVAPRRILPSRATAQYEMPVPADVNQYARTILIRGYLSCYSQKIPFGLMARFPRPAYVPCDLSARAAV